MTENIDHLADAATAPSPWLGSREAWKLLNALSSGLLLQPWTAIPSGLQLIETGASVLMTKENGESFHEKPKADTIWLAVDRVGLRADLWLPNTRYGFRRLTGALPWTDLESGALWFFGHRYRGPFVHLDVNGIHVSSEMPSIDMVAHGGGFDSAQSRAAELQVRF